MLNLYDVVILKQGLKSPAFPPGTRGTVLIAFESNPPAYEVEFVKADGSSLGTFTIAETDLEKSDI